MRLEKTAGRGASRALLTMPLVLALLLALAPATARRGSAAPAAVMPTTSAEIPAGGKAAFAVSGFAYNPGSVVPSGGALSGLAPAGVRAVLFYGVEWGYAESDPAQVLAAIWYAQDATWRNDGDHAVAERVAGAGSANNSPSWNTSGQSLTAAIEKGFAKASVTQFAASGLDGRMGKGVITIENISRDTIRLYLPYGALVAGADGATAIVWATGADVSAPKAAETSTTAVPPTNTAIATATSTAAQKPVKSDPKTPIAGKGEPAAGITATATATITSTATVAATAKPSKGGPGLTESQPQPSATSVPPTATDTATVPPTVTSTATVTAVPPSPTLEPPKATYTLTPLPATATEVPPTETAVPPTATETETATATLSATATLTSKPTRPALPPTATATEVPPTATVEALIDSVSSFVDAAPLAAEVAAPEVAPAADPAAVDSLPLPLAQSTSQPTIPAAQPTGNVPTVAVPTETSASEETPTETATSTETPSSELPLPGEDTATPTFEAVPVDTVAPTETPTPGLGDEFPTPTPEIFEEFPTPEMPVPATPDEGLNSDPGAFPTPDYGETPTAIIEQGPAVQPTTGHTSDGPGLLLSIGVLALLGGVFMRLFSGRSRKVRESVEAEDAISKA